MELVEKTGARLYEPQIGELSAHLARISGERARFDRELREVQRLFTEMGATGQAERVARLLSQHQSAGSAGLD